MLGQKILVRGESRVVCVGKEGFNFGELFGHRFRANLPVAVDLLCHGEDRCLNQLQERSVIAEGFDECANPHEQEHERYRG